MSELAKAYNPGEHEDSIKQRWEASGFFNPDNLPLPEDAPTYTIILPPPNVTDRLHLGHASMLAIQDLLIRFYRMNGYRTLWLPGTDHAAIATQAVVEKRIYKEEGKTRHDLGREEFLRRVMDFALENQKTILGQIKSFGASIDWSRLAFTIDESRQKAVRQMFVDMYNAGAIYRGERIVNWCPHCQSTLADDEVEYKPEKTTLYTFKYWADFPIAISSTRPETKLGDTAVAVNPSDDRYKKYIGQEFSGEFCGQPLTIKIIADREVDMNFGTGALGVTPAHSHTDWRIAEENNLKIIKVIGEAGKIVEGFEPYSGQLVSEAREGIVNALREENLITHEEEIEHNLSVCYRCGTSIEPLPSKQWFVAVGKPLDRFNGKSLKEKALEVSEKGEITFMPDRFKKRYEDWMKNLRDWCISRQIWFGHSIPVWYRNEEVYVGLEAPVGDDWHQDSDTLDTWFSSGMWTFSTLGWPDTTTAISCKPDSIQKKGDLAKFHPTNVLETGYEIITLWVSRMIMMSLFALNEVPFKNVYLHGMVLDAQGKKMSKSKGNGLDPVEVSKQYGNDAVRLSLLLGNTPGVDVRLSEEKIASSRNFTNKLWNISRYIMSQSGSESTGKTELTIADRWIQSRLQKTIKIVTEKIKAHDFSAAGETLREFTLDDLADWYLEASKFENSTQAPVILKDILRTILKLWHPFMPFVTEVIWKELEPEAHLLLITSWPQEKNNLEDTEAEDSFALIQSIITLIRNVRSEHRIEPGQKLKTIIYTGDRLSVIENCREIITSLRTGVGELEIKKQGDVPLNSLLAATQGIEIYIEAQIDTEAERLRLTKEIEYVQKGISSIEKKLANPEFKNNAPELIFKQEEKKLTDYQLSFEKLSQQLKDLPPS